jgi:hypothetical protein
VIKLPSAAAGHPPPLPHLASCSTVGLDGNISGNSQLQKIPLPNPSECWFQGNNFDMLRKILLAMTLTCLILNVAVASASVKVELDRSLPHNAQVTRQHAYSAMVNSCQRRHDLVA